MNGLGTDKSPIAQAQRVYSPADTGWTGSGITYGNVSAQTGNAIDVSGYGTWSVFVSVTAAGLSTLTLHIMQELSETTELVSLPISTIVPGGSVVTHYTFGAIGSALPVVPARLVKFGLLAAAGAGFFGTIRCYGRGF